MWKWTKKKKKQLEDQKKKHHFRQSNFSSLSPFLKENFLGSSRRKYSNPNILSSSLPTKHLLKILSTFLSSIFHLP